MREIGADGRKDTWEYRAGLARQYMAEHGTRHIPQDVVVDGIWLGKWLAVQRKALETGKLSPAQEKLLEGIPMLTKNETLWEDAYGQAAAYYKKHGNLDVPKRYLTEGGYRLGNWVIRQRQLRKKGSLSDEQVRRLDAIGFIWETGKMLDTA